MKFASDGLTVTKALESLNCLTICLLNDLLLMKSGYERLLMMLKYG